MWNLMFKDLRCSQAEFDVKRSEMQVEFYIISTQMPVNVTQKGTGRGPAYNLLGYGARGPDGQVRLFFPFVCLNN